MLTLYRDNVPTIHIKTWSLAATLFEGEVAGGPVPTLFAADPEVAKAAISADVLKAHWDVNKMSRVLMEGESVNLKEAVALMKKPR